MYGMASELHLRDEGRTWQVRLPSPTPPVRHMRNLVFQALALLMFVLARSTSAAAQTTAAPEQVTLAPGDSVRVVVWRKPEMSGDFIVAPDGSISHPLYRTVRVGGIPFGTAEVNVRNFLARFEQDPQFVIEPLVRIAISGEVGRPQVFALRPETTLSEAVAQAGGPTQFAKRDRVRVLRREGNGSQREFYFNLQDPDRTSSGLRVRSGDQIVVERKKSLFRDVVLPGLTVLGSVASIYLVIDRNVVN
jgi:protein involved in polysaccharide export with SLBB domain